MWRNGFRGDLRVTKKGDKVTADHGHSVEMGELACEGKMGGRLAVLNSHPWNDF